MISNIFRKPLMLLAAASLTIGLGTSCSDEETVYPQTAKTYDMTGFAKGADVSWLTEMEDNSIKFYNTSGTEQECMSLLRDQGVNSIRLRVWVNPSDGWCDKQDLLVKAWRASKLGFRIMVDFHYSDSWADPGQQTTPTAWADYDLEELKSAVAEHTKEVLNLLKTNGIDVEWVQVGNETRDGMLWPIGQISNNGFSNFAALVNSGYDAVKEVYPNAKVIVHIDKGEVLSYSTYLFDGLAENDAKWDVIGLSLYPDVDSTTGISSTWESQATTCLDNVKTLISKYSCEVMIVEVGMSWDDENSYNFMNKLVTEGKTITNCLGVFYWEPQAYNSWEGYAKGAFNASGMPTSALSAFKN